VKSLLNGVFFQENISVTSNSIVCAKRRNPAPLVHL